MTLLAPVSWGELIDKITILEIKAARIADPAKHANVARELAALIQVRDENGPLAADIAPLTAELRTINERLWEVEDALRACEAAGRFDARFVDLARQVYRHNDRRAALKRRINALL